MSTPDASSRRMDLQLDRVCGVLGLLGGLYLVLDRMHWAAGDAEGRVVLTSVGMLGVAVAGSVAVSRKPNVGIIAAVLAWGVASIAAAFAGMVLDPERPPPGSDRLVLLPIRADAQALALAMGVGALLFGAAIIRRRFLQHRPAGAMAVVPGALALNAGAIFLIFLPTPFHQPQDQPAGRTLAGIGLALAAAGWRAVRQRDRRGHGSATAPARRDRQP